MDSSTGGQQETFKGLNRTEQLLLVLFRRMSEQDQSHIFRVAGALAETDDAEEV
ncbi:hypothetical protein [Marinobacter sp.]|uniref:hypothetical protein n=1 Tax=Marinobacter sp. TaxID=50741 RepID=UPI003A91DCE0